jgi:hypothetical protein
MILEIFFVMEEKCSISTKKIQDLSLPALSEDNSKKRRQAPPAATGRRPSTGRAGAEAGSIRPKHPS